MSKSNPTLRDAIENKTLAFGHSLQDLMKDQVPSVFDRRHWEGRILDWAMGDADFKTDLSRFVDVLPTLGSTKQIASHCRLRWKRVGSSSHRLCNRPRPVNP